MKRRVCLSFGNMVGMVRSTDVKFDHKVFIMISKEFSVYVFICYAHLYLHKSKMNEKTILYFNKF